MISRAPPIRNYVPLDVAQGIQLALVRTDLSQVFMHLTLSDNFPKEIDKHRLAFVLIDNEIVIDMCNFLHASKVYDSTIPGRVFFNSDERTVLGVIWHGIIKEGAGLVGRLASCNRLALRVYFKDYTQEEFEIATDSLEIWKNNIARSFLGGS